MSDKEAVGGGSGWWWIGIEKKKGGWGWNRTEGSRDRREGEKKFPPKILKIIIERISSEPKQKSNMIPTTTTTKTKQHLISLLIILGHWNYDTLGRGELEIF